MSYGYATDGTLGSRFNVLPVNNDVGSSSWLGASYNSQTSQVAPFVNNYEPPIFWNAGDIASYETVQGAAAAAGKVSYDDSDMTAAGNNIGDSTPAYQQAQPTGSFRAKGYLGNKKKGYYTPGVGVAIGKGYATNMPNGGRTASGQLLMPY